MQCSAVQCSVNIGIIMHILATTFVQIALYIGETHDN